ncbi:MAG: hypothetical protein KAI39_08070 [Desulfobulbaceae bacterium]|nr:hypothetical protein [Desulfobulbaceae bacterium]
MNCTDFTSWLENRDTYDLSEADRAMKHAARCVKCKEYLQKDEELDLFITKMFQYEKMDKRIYSQIDRTLQASPRKRGLRGGIAAALAMMVVVGLFFVLNPAPANFSSIDELGKYVALDHNDHGGTIPLFEEIQNIEEWALDNLHYSFDLKGLPAGNMKMVGGRICTIKNCNFAHLLYKDSEDFYSLFVVTEDEIGFHMEPGRIYSLTVEGVELRIWQRQERVYALTG